MWLLRLLAAVLVIAIGISLILYFATGRRDYRWLAGQLFRYGVIFALLVFALMIIERLAIIPW